MGEQEVGLVVRAEGLHRSESCEMVWQSEQEMVWLQQQEDCEAVGAGRWFGNESSFLAIVLNAIISQNR
uniref:Uncharacterized protein n=1 Tax=Amphimedon queenslandica TaxID=400682 RepID=A0A1X7TZ70_AMPQE